MELELAREPALHEPVVLIDVLEEDALAAACAATSRRSLTTFAIGAFAKRGAGMRGAPAQAASSSTQPPHRRLARASRSWIGSSVRAMTKPPSIDEAMSSTVVSRPTMMPPP